MKKRILNIIFLLMILVVPNFIKAKTLTTYDETVKKVNDYIVPFENKRKYLIFNTDYGFNKSGVTADSNYKYGGLLSKYEFDLSVDNNLTYLSNGKEYWTLSKSEADSASNYYIDAYALAKKRTSTSGTRVTEYIKPGIALVGEGTFTTPWVFTDGFEVDIISNNTNFGTVTPSGKRYFLPGGTQDYEIKPKNGYYYVKAKDECMLTKIGGSAYDNTYRLSAINKDISCTAVFELVTYNFQLIIPDKYKDYNQVHKTYTTNPSVNPIYFKYRTDWYSDVNTNNVITGITPPSITGYTFKGYYYNEKTGNDNGTLIIRPDGTFTTTDVELNDYVKRDHILEAKIVRNQYNVKYDLADEHGSGICTNCPSNIKTYDEVFSVANPSRIGYEFTGWTLVGGTTTAKIGTSENNVNTTWNGTTKTKATYFVNLTPIDGKTVTLKANWHKNNYNISYQMNGGTKVGNYPESVNYDEIITLATPTKFSGPTNNYYYDFLGWTYTNGDGSTAKYNSNIVDKINNDWGELWTNGSEKKKYNFFMNLTPTKNKTVTMTANWVPHDWVISYNLDGGSVSPENPTKYNYETPTFTLNNPTRTGYRFDGWTGTGLSGKTITVTIPVNSHDEREYTANWTSYCDESVIKYVDGTYCTKECGGGTYNRLAYSNISPTDWRCPQYDTPGGGSPCNTQSCSKCPTVNCPSGGSSGFIFTAWPYNPSNYRGPTISGGSDVRCKIYDDRDGHGNPNHEASITQYCKVSDSGDWTAVITAGNEKCGVCNFTIAYGHKWNTIYGSCGGIQTTHGGPCGCWGGNCSWDFR